MATIRATFILTDKASGELDKIHDSALRAENRLKTLDKQMERMGKDHHRAVDGISRDLTQWDGDSEKTSRSILDRLDAIDKKVSGFTKRKSVIRVEADTSHAERELGKLDRAMQRVMGRGGDRNNGQRFLGGVGRGLAGIVGGIRGSIGRSTQKIGLNLGPISTRLSMLMPLLVAIGGPVASAAAAGLSTVAVAITALGAASIGVIGILGAVTAGIASMAVPIGMAVSKFNDKRKALELATEHLNKYKHGTKNYAKAQREVNVAMAAFTTEEKKALSNLTLLQGAWGRFVTNGPSGRRAMGMINSSLEIATRLVPTLAKQMDKFTARGSNLFSSAQNNLPGFQRQLDATMSSWPHIFEQMGKATGHFAMGFLRLLQAASPTLVWMADKTLEIAENFDLWMRDPDNFKKVRDWFKKMEEPISRIASFAWSFASAFVALGSSSGSISNVSKVLDSLERGMGWLVREVPGLTDSFVQDLLPTLERSAELIGNMWTLTAPIINQALEAATRVTEMLNEMDGNKGSIIALAGMIAMTGAGQSVLGATGGLLGKGLGLLGRGRGGGGAGGAGAAVAGKAMNGLDDLPRLSKGQLAKGVARRAGGLVNAAADILAPNVHVTNTVGSPVPVLIVGDLSAGVGRGGGRGRLGRLGGRGGGLLGALATVLGLGAVMAPELDVPEKAPSTPQIRANPIHRNRPVVNPNPVPGGLKPLFGSGVTPTGPPPGGVMPGEGYKAAWERYRMEQAGQNPFAPVPRSTNARGETSPGYRLRNTAAENRARVAALQAGGGATLPGSSETGRLHSGMKQSAALAGATWLAAAGGLAAGGPAGAMVAGSRTLRLGAAGGAGFGAAAARGAPAMAATPEVTPKVNAPMDSLSPWIRRVQALIDTTSSKGANQTAQRARAANRVMTTNAQAGARSMLTTFQTAIAGLWELVGAAVSSAASALGQIASSAAAALGLGGGGTSAGVPESGNVPEGVNPVLGGIASMGRAAGLQITSGLRPGDDGLHGSGRALDFSNGSSPTPQMDSFFKQMEPIAARNPGMELIYKNTEWDHGKKGNYAPNDHFNHVHVGFRGDSVRSGGPSRSHREEKSNNSSGGVVVSFSGANFIIKNGDDYDQVVEQLVERLSAAFAANGITSASEMTGS